MKLEYPEIRMLIGGEWVKGTSGRRRPVVNPADESVLTHIDDANPADLDRAIAAAMKGFALWRKTAPIKRTEILMTAARLLRERKDDIARLASQEEGQPWEEGKSYVLRAAEIIEWDAERGAPCLWPHRARGTRSADAGDARADRTGRCVHAVECTGVYTLSQDRQRACRWLLLDHEGR